MGLSFHWDAFDIEGMVGEKIVSFNFGGAVVPALRTPGARALSQTRTRQLALGLPCLCAGLARVHGCRSWQDPRLMNPESGPSSLWSP